MCLNNLASSTTESTKSALSRAASVAMAMGLSGDSLRTVFASFIFYSSCYFIKSVLAIHIRNLECNDVIVGWTMAIISGSAMVTKLVTGALHDKLGSKRFILGSSICLACVTLSYSFAKSIPMLMITAMFHGVALGSFAISSQAQMLCNANSEAERTSAVSIFSMTHLTALAIAPGIALALASKRTTATVLVWATIGGVLALLLGTSLKPAALDRSNESGTIGVILDIVKNRPFIGASLVYIAWAICYSAVFTFLPLYGRERGIMNVGVFFTSYAVVNLAGKLAVRGLVSHLGARRVINISSVFSVVSMCLLVLLQNHVSLAVAGVAYGLGSFSLYPCLAATVVSSGSQGLGMSIALLAANFELGQMVGSVGLGNISTRLGYPVAYGAAVIAMCVGLSAYNILTGSSISDHEENSVNLHL